MKKYLVTGGAGFIGSHLVDKLIEKGNKVIVIDNLSSGKKENLNTKAEFYQLDICDLDKIKPFFEGIDCVFHLAAIPSVPLSVEDPSGTSRVNILGTVNVFKAAIDSNVKRVIFASSSAIYGNQEIQPIKEVANPNPISPYGLQKLVGEQFAKLFTELYGIEIISLRYFNVYGPRIDSNSSYGAVIGKFLRLQAENKPFTIFGSGEQTRGFCYVDDVVDANIKASEADNLNGGEVINISNKESYSINFLVKIMGGEVEYLPGREGDLINSKADITLAESLLGWKPKTEFDEGIKKTKQWFQEYGK